MAISCKGGGKQGRSYGGEGASRAFVHVRRALLYWWWRPYCDFSRLWAPGALCAVFLPWWKNARFR